MANHIDDATIEYVGILAKLELSGEEKEQAKKDMESMLDYVDKRTRYKQCRTNVSRISSEECIQRRRGNEWRRKRRHIKERTRSAGQRLCRAKDDHIGGRR